MPIQEEISQRASPNRCDGRDDDDPKEIQPSITRGEHSNAPKIEGMEDHRPSRNAERCAQRPGASIASSRSAEAESWATAKTSTFCRSTCIYSPSRGHTLRLEA